MMDLAVLTHGPEETFLLGSVVGELLEPGDFLALDGELGAGKTQFVRGLAAGAALAADDLVSSPTFTLINEYRCRIPLHHLDLYRLTSAEEVLELGFDEYLANGGAMVVEWPDRLKSELPQELLLIRFTIIGEMERELVFHGSGQRYVTLVGLIGELMGKKMF